MKKVLLLSLLLFTLINTSNSRLEQPDNLIVYASWRDNYASAKKETPDTLSEKPCVFCACIK